MDANVQRDVNRTYGLRLLATMKTLRDGINLPGRERGPQSLRENRALKSLTRMLVMVEEINQLCRDLTLVLVRQGEEMLRSGHTDKFDRLEAHADRLTYELEDVLYTSRDIADHARVDISSALGPCNEFDSELIPDKLNLRPQMSDANRRFNLALNYADSVAAVAAKPLLPVVHRLDDTL